MPLHHDIRSRHGSWLRRRLDRVARALRHDAARRPAGAGDLALPSPASPPVRCSRGSLRRLDERGAAQLASLAAGSNVGARVVRPGVAAALRAIAERRALGVLRRCLRGGPDRAGQRPVLAATTWHARRPTGSSRSRTTVFGVDLHTIPPNSQGYLTLGRAPPRRAGRPSRRSRRSGVGARPDRVRDRRRLRPAHRPPRSRRREGVARCDRQRGPS